MYTLHVFGSASYITQRFCKIMISVSFFNISLSNVYKLSKHHVFLPCVKNCENEHAHISLRICVVLLSVNTDTIKTLKSVKDQTAHCNLWFQWLKITTTLQDIIRETGGSTRFFIFLSTCKINVINEEKLLSVAHILVRDFK